MDVDAVSGALQRLGPRACASHDTAAQLWGIDLVDAPVARVTVPQQRSRVDLPGWVVRRMDLPAEDVVVVQGVRTTTPLRTVLDLARVLPLPHAVVSADSALRLGLTDQQELCHRLRTSRGRGCDRLRALAPLVDPRAESVLESMLRVLLVQAGLQPEPQVVVRAHGEFVARLDLAWPKARLAVEADGFSFHSDRASFRKDRRRLNRLALLGWTVLRFTWEDVMSRPEAVVAAVRQALAVTA